MNNATCTVNGEIVPCPEFLTNIGPAIIGFLVGFWIVGMILVIIMLVATWKIFVKAGKPGWACLIPIYNVVVLLEIVRKPTWWVILMFIPFVNIVLGILLCIELAKAFGKSSGFAVGLVLLNFIFIPILGFGKSQYVYGEQAPAYTPSPTPEPLPPSDTPAATV